MVVAHLQKREIENNEADRLQILEKSFNRLAKARPKVLEALANATTNKRNYSRFMEQSLEHHRITRSMLSLIDQYVKLHLKTRQGIKVILPLSMRDELNKLKIHRPLKTFVTTANLRRAIKAHDKRQLTLHGRAEALIGRHGIGLTLGSTSHKRA